MCSFVYGANLEILTRNKTPKREGDREGEADREGERNGDRGGEKERVGSGRGLKKRILKRGKGGSKEEKS